VLHQGGGEREIQRIEFQRRQSTGNAAARMIELSERARDRGKSSAPLANDFVFDE
jgi:hypothetical protein